MNNTLQRFCFILLCLVLVTCRHEPVVTPAQCAYDSSVEEMKIWYYFKTGTWWVYEEQNSGVLDTITVYYDWSGYNTSGSQGFEWYGNSSLDGFNYKYSFNDSFSIHCLNSEKCTCHKVKRAKTQPGNYIGEEWLFLFPIIENNFNYVVGYPNGQDTSGTSTITDINLEFIIGSDTIRTCARFDITTDQSVDGWPSSYVWAKSIGIVQMEFPTSNQIWNLIEYEIVQ